MSVRQHARFPGDVIASLQVIEELSPDDVKLGVPTGVGDSAVSLLGRTVGSPPLTHVGIVADRSAPAYPFVVR
jgi:hypothetical protein